MIKKKYDFGGWATKYGVKCSDGRIITKGAFSGNNGQKIPLVWNHNHGGIEGVIGNATLEHREDGVYAYCKLNDTENGRTARVLIENGDIDSLSIYANKLKQNGNEVVHGEIKELSLVLAGANPYAKIDDVLAHGELKNDDEYLCWSFNNEIQMDIEHSEITNEDCIEHSDEEKTVEEIFNTFTEKQKTAFYAIMTQILDEGVDAEDATTPTTDNNSADNTDGEDETVADVFNTLSDVQKKVAYIIIAAALDEKGSENQNVQHNMGDTESMHTNIFEKKTNKETNAEETTQRELTHSEFAAIMDDTKRCGNLRDAFLQHGIENVEVLKPDAKDVADPATLARDMDWVADVLGAAKHVPFARLKSTYLDITAEEARAKGYVTGAQKADEVISAFKRSTDPQTIYKVQKLDRDTYLDITSFNVVAYLKSEMKTMLNEEVARAMLIGDGRSSGSADKVDPTHIRPIWGDNAAYVTNKVLVPGEKDTEYTFAKSFIREARKMRKHLKGSGSPVFYCGEDFLNDMLLIEDTNGRLIYETEESLAKALRVKKIVAVPVIDGAVREGESKNYQLLGVFVNMADYALGNDKGGDVTFFEDFNLDYNKMEYLIETRRSGALIKPKSAITFEKEVNKD